MACISNIAVVSRRLTRLSEHDLAAISTYELRVYLAVIDDAVHQALKELDNGA